MENIFQPPSTCEEQREKKNITTVQPLRLLFNVVLSNKIVYCAAGLRACPPDSLRPDTLIEFYGIPFL